MPAKEDVRGKKALVRYHQFHHKARAEARWQNLRLGQADSRREALAPHTVISSRQRGTAG